MKPEILLVDDNAREIALALLAQLKADARAQAVQVVVMTTSREPRDIAESYRFGTNGYVVKPVDFERFKDVARKLCDHWLGLNELPQES